MMSAIRVTVGPQPALPSTLFKPCTEYKPDQGEENYVRIPTDLNLDRQVLIRPFGTTLEEIENVFHESTALNWNVVSTEKPDYKQ